MAELFELIPYETIGPPLTAGRARTQLFYIPVTHTRNGKSSLERVVMVKHALPS